MELVEQIEHGMIVIAVTAPALYAAIFICLRTPAEVQ